MRLTKIYTKVGDGGKTLLATGEKISKASGRIEAYGTVDELNSCIGIVRDGIRVSFSGKFLQIDDQLKIIQNKLFDIGGELATPNYDVKQRGGISESDITDLESSMDGYNESIPPLKNFVLPGGHLVNSYLHLSRTVCRRAERLVVRNRESDNGFVRPEVPKYLNRLSDWLFVASRKILIDEGIEEVLWEQFPNS